MHNKPSKVHVSNMKEEFSSIQKVNKPLNCLFACLFELILYVPVYNLSVMSVQVFLG